MERIVTNDIIEVRECGVLVARYDVFEDERRDRFAKSGEIYLCHGEHEDWVVTIDACEVAVRVNEVLNYLADGYTVRGELGTPWDGLTDDTPWCYGTERYDGIQLLYEDSIQSGYKTREEALGAAYDAAETWLLEEESPAA